MMQEEECTGDDSICEERIENEDACSTCDCYKACYGEYPWDAANAEYYSSRGC